MAPAHFSMITLGRVAVLAAAAHAARLVVSIVADQLLADYDSSISLARGAGRLGQLLVWDSVHFVHIACRGYSLEQQYAFFPALPVLLRPWCPDPDRAAAAGLALSFAAAVVSAVLLAALSLNVTGDPSLSKLATLLFIFNPAAAFHVAVYTEGLYGTLTLLGLAALFVPAAARDSERHITPHAIVTHLRMWAAAACFTLASATRSNGVVNAGFVLHFVLQAAISGASHRRGPLALLRAAVLVASGFCASLGVAAPLVLHQLHAHALLCAGAPDAAPNPALAASTAGRALRLVLGLLWRPMLEQAGARTAIAGRFASPLAGHWCVRHPAWWPHVYAHVQKAFWGVGLLRYWRVSQVPNFLLAAPMLVVAGAAVVSYAHATDWHLLFGAFTWPDVRLLGKPMLAVVAGGSRGRGAALGGRAGRATAMRSGEHSLIQPPGGRSHHVLAPVTGYYSQRVGVFVYPLAFLAACALLFMHVQVATRFLSSSPAVYWYLAHVLQHGTNWRPGKSNGGLGAVTRLQSLVWGWCWAYGLLGSVLFVNFYPWT